MVLPSDGRVRRIPAFYLRGALVYAHRDVNLLFPRLHRTIEAIRDADEVSTYTVQACEIGGRRGLYARDMNGRSVFRRRLIREGLKFAADPFVKFDRGAFYCRDWGVFAPTFMIAGFGDEHDESLVVAPPGGEVLFDVARARFGAIPPREFRVLAETLRGFEVVSSGDASALAAYLG